MTAPDGFWVFSDEGESGVGPDGRPIDFRLRRVGRTAQRVPLDELADNVDEFLAGTRLVIERGAQQGGLFALDSVDVHAKIGVDGKVGFLGTGAGFAAEAGVTFTFRRNELAEAGETQA